ncbi:MAG: hypothetical protein H6606_09815 [Flavobacteriales bacterium]|nr:hypothetical protein [Flavobacteriales bacterium]
MKLKSVLAWAILLPGFPFIANAQVLSKEAHGLKRIETERFIPKYESMDHFYIPMDFNDAESNKMPSGFIVEDVVSVSLIYTQFKLSERFDQLELNARRTRELFKRYPELKGARDIRWYWIAQTGCSDPGTCRDFFHGFEIRTRSISEKIALERESRLLDFYTDMSSGKEVDTDYLDSLSQTGTSSIVKRCDTLFSTVALHKNTYGVIKDLQPRSKAKFIRKARRKTMDTPGQFTAIVDSRNKVIEVEGVSGNDSLQMLNLLNKHFRFYSSRYERKKVFTRFEFHLTDGPDPLQIHSIPLHKDGSPIPEFEDEYKTTEKVTCYFVDTLSPGGGRMFGDHIVIQKVLDRNVNNWRDALIVTDVTGSMYPYLGQFLAWHQLHLKTKSKNHDFVFFNDGDNMSDYLKKSGKVGGTYYIKTTNYTELKEQLTHAQHMGGGGDGPENNIEAVLYGIAKNPNVKEIIMIADNWATPRDLEFIDKVKKPIRLILCGTYSGFNVEYLNMIRKNGGSVHTIEEDLMNLAELNEGETIEIQGRNYVVRGGQIINDDERTVRVH